MGRIKRLLQKELLLPTKIEIVCPICDRKIPRSQLDAHHLIPKSKGGKKTEFLHRICHRQIHALFTETELARQFNSVSALLAHADIKLFVAWVKNKPDNVIERTKKSHALAMKKNHLR
jgi:5-methylcytosine-specific restriction endonuclease McrA